MLLMLCRPAEVKTAPGQRGGSHAEPGHARARYRDHYPPSPSAGGTDNQPPIPTVFVSGLDHHGLSQMSLGDWEGMML